jgi:hypothetical protein
VGSQCHRLRLKPVFRSARSRRAKRSSQVMHLSLRQKCGNGPRQAGLLCINVRATGVRRLLNRATLHFRNYARADGLARRRSQRRRQPGQRAARPGPPVAERGGVCETQRRPRTAGKATRAYNKCGYCLGYERRLTGSDDVGIRQPLQLGAWRGGGDDLHS